MKISQIIQKKNKRAVSPILGYVLLVTLGLVMSGIAYNYLKTYVPQEAADCPEGVSLFIKEYSCDSTTFNITMKNNGKFDIMGYFIHASNNSNLTISTLNLAESFVSSESGEARVQDKSWIVYSIGKGNNYMTPKVEEEHRFSMNIPNIISIQITPVRNEIINNKQRFAICSNSRIKETITCSP